MKLVKDEELVRGVEDQRHEADSGEVFHGLTKELGPPGGVGQDCPQEGGLPIAGVFQASAEGEERDNGGHDHKTEVQGPDGSSEQLVEPVGEDLQGCFSSLFVLDDL